LQEHFSNSCTKLIEVLVPFVANLYSSVLGFADNNIAVAEVKGKKICIAKFKDDVFAVAYKCPHAGGIMADGYIDPLGNVVCPLHRYKYSLQNGRNVSGEGYYLKHWPVELRGDGVYIGLE
jgi:nitrite reductase/ring-hydroxylating ferredoxin subunit